jgi:hypothetical protein
VPDVSGSTVMTAPASERMYPILPCRDLDADERASLAAELDHVEALLR